MKSGEDRQQIETEEAEIVLELQGRLAGREMWPRMQLGSIGQIGRMKKRIRRTACPDQWIERRGWIKSK